MGPISMACLGLLVCLGLDTGFFLGLNVGLGLCSSTWSQYPLRAKEVEGLVDACVEALVDALVEARVDARLAAGRIL